MANKKAPAPPAKKAAAKKVKTERPTSNGISRPASGTQTGTVWDVADKLSTKGNPAERSAVMEACVKAKVNPATVATQYQRWRVFYNIPKRAGGPKAGAAKKAVPKAPAKKGAKKAAPKPPAKRAPKAPAAPAATA